MITNRVKADETDVELQPFGIQNGNNNSEMIPTEHVVNLINPKTPDEWRVVTAYIKSNAQSLDTCNKILAHAINTECDDDILKALFAVSIKANLQHLKQAFDAESPRQLKLILENNSDLYDEESLISAAEASRFAFVNTYLNFKHADTRPVTLTRVFAAACLQKNFGQIKTLIETYYLTIDDLLPKNHYKAGDLCDVYDSKQVWREARVLESDGTTVKVEYIGWPAKWNETIDVIKSNSRFAKYQTLSRQDDSQPKQFLNWQRVFQTLFLNAKEVSDWDFVNKYLTQLIDMNDIEYLKKLFQYAIECKANSAIVYMLILVKELDAEKFCIDLAKDNNWPFVSELLKSNRLKPVTISKLIKIAMNLNNFYRFEMFFLHDINTNFPVAATPASELKNKKALQNTFLKATTLDDWKFISTIIVRASQYYKFDGTYLSKLLSAAIVTEANNEIITSIASSIIADLSLTAEVFEKAVRADKMEWVRLLKNENISGLAIAVAEKEKWVITNAFLRMELVKDIVVLQKLLFIALKQTNLTQLMVLHAYNMQVANLTFKHQIVPENFDINTLQPGFTQYDIMDGEFKWRKGIIKRRLGDRVLIKFNIYDDNDNYSEWIDIKAYPNQFAHVFKFTSVKAGVKDFNYKKLLENTFLKAVTADEWNFVHQAMLKLSITTKFDNTFLQFLFNSAVNTNADENMLSFLLSLNLIVLPRHIVSAIAMNKVEWINKINTESIATIALSAEHSGLVEVIELLHSKKLIIPEILQSLLVTSIIFGELNRIINLVTKGANITDLKLNEVHIKGFHFNRLLPGITSDVYFRSGTKSEFQWCHASIYERVGNEVFVSFINKHTKWNQWRELNNEFAFAKTASVTQNVIKNVTQATLSQFLATDFLKATTADDWSFVRAHINDFLSSVVDRKTFLGKLLDKAINSDADNDTLIYLISLDFPLLPNHLNSCFMQPTNRQVTTLLRENKDIINESALRLAGLNNDKSEHVLAYIDARMPEAESIASLISDAFKDSSNNYAKFKELIAHAGKYKQQMTQAIQLCFQKAYRSNQIDFAILLVDLAGVQINRETQTNDYSRMPVLNNFLLTASTEQEWIFISRYIAEVEKDKFEESFLEKLFEHALNDKRYSIALTCLRKLSVLIMVTTNKQKLIVELIAFCDQRIEDGLSPQSIHRNTIWDRVKAITPEAKLIAASKFTYFLISSKDILNVFEKAILKNKDIKLILDKSPQEFLPQAYRF